MSKHKSIKDLFWSLSDNLSQQIMNFVVGIILARLLTPQDFGLVGIITVFIVISNVFVDGGFSSALIHRKNPKEVDFNTVFYTNILLSSFIYLLLFIFSEKIALFFNNTQLKDMIRLAGLNIILLSFSAIHRTIIVRNLNFKLLTLVSFIAVFISATVAIFLAYKGFGVYSLILRVLIGEVATIVLFWTLNKWRPKLEFSFTSLREMFAYGSNLLFANLLNSLHSNVFYFIIGKFYSPAQLGFYTRATTFRDLASSNISNTIKRVSFSTLTKIENQEEKVDKYLFFRGITFLLSSTLMLILFFCAKEIIIILLSEKWLDSVWILKVLSTVGVFLTLYNIGLDYLAVEGKTKLLLKIEILGKLLIIPIIFIGFYTSFKIFIYCIIVQIVIMYCINLFVLKNLSIKIFKADFINVLKYVFVFFIAWLIVINVEDYITNYYSSTIIKALIIIALVAGANYSLIKNIKG